MFIKNKTHLIVLFFTLLIPTISFAKNNLNLSNDERKILFKAMEENKTSISKTFLKHCLMLTSSAILGYSTMAVLNLKPMIGDPGFSKNFFEQFKTEEIAEITIFTAIYYALLYTILKPTKNKKYNDNIHKQITSLAIDQVRENHEANYN
ncbi:hypothetical protein GF322_03390 [Candidatus Dependentiae bacterium]|nr:hypothetical protein [Candidatus Dependentiae bacterium]